MDNEKKEIDKLFEFLSSWGARNNFKFVTPSDDEKNIDFININFKTNTIYVDELNVTEPLTEVG
jgi:hypothetical protein